MTVIGPYVAGWHASAAEAQLNIGLEEVREIMKVGPSATHYPKDSLLALSAQRAESWMRTLQGAPSKGLQLDPASIVGVVARDEAFAERQIAARLATPGLSLVDRAFTLATAVTGFASADFPARLPKAERYLAQLDALGTPAAYWQKSARLALTKVYFQLGRATDVIRTGTRAMQLIRDVPFDWQTATGFLLVEMDSYVQLCAALSGQPDGRAKIDAVNAAIMAGTTAPPALLARDSSYWTGMEINAKYMANRASSISERIGRPGTPLVANYWINRGPTRDSQTVAVNDGKIRVIEFHGLGCEGCVDMMFAMERLHQQHPDVEFVTMGYAWVTRGNRVVGAKAVADDMADHIINKLHVTYPYGIVLPTKSQATDDDGSVLVPEIEMHDAKTYPVYVTPTFYVLDGRGMIRMVYTSGGRETEELMSQMIDFLRKEQTSTPVAITPPTTRPTTPSIPPAFTVFTAARGR